MGYLYLVTTLLPNAYGQLALKWQIDEAGTFSAETGEHLEYCLFNESVTVANLVRAALIVSGLIMGSQNW
jgi:hypothetical protein